MASRVEELIANRVAALPAGLRQHTYRVQQVALELALQHEVDEEKVGLGALAHDIARAMKGELRWTQSVGQNRGHVKSGSCCLKRLQ